MTRSALSSLFLFLALGTALSGERRFAFDKDDAVYVADANGGSVKRVADGIFPALSPDGRRIAFNTVEKSGTTYVRHIAVVDIDSGKTTVCKDVPSENSYNTTWSPDGKWIAFTLRREQVWDLGMVKEDGTGFNLIKKGAENEATLYSPCWSRDKQSIFCQDMTNIYRLGLDGVVLAQWKIEKIIPNGNMSGDGRLSLAPDGKRLLLSVEMGEEHHRKDWDGPPPALWSFDTDTQRAVRLTSKNLFAWDGCWLDNDTLLFLSQASGEKEPSIYRMSANGKNLKRLIKGGRMPSASSE